MATGTYQEPLPCGGKLHVTVGSWQIEYYFLGPDLRYKGTFFRVAGSNVDSFISALEANWRDFGRLKDTVPAGGSFTKAGQMEMTIRVGFAQGVCLHGHHMPIASEAHLQKVIASYRYAAKRAPALQKMLASL